jgi:putative ABC transport system permease protein
VSLASVDRGLVSSGVIVATIALPNAQFVDTAARTTTRLAIESEMRQLPGIAHAAASFGLPPDAGFIHLIDDLRATNGRSPVGEFEVDSYLVGSDFFELYRIPMVAGRSFRHGDGEHRVIVGERLAAIVWPDRNPVGETMTFDNGSYEVIGVAREIHHPSIDPRADRPEFYQPLVSRSGNFFSVSLRCGSSCPDPALVRHRLISINPAIRVVHVGSLDAAYFVQLAAPRAAAALGSVFAATALLASAGGIFGTLTFFVARRRREFGVRLALGASRPQIRRLVARDSLVIACVGITLGLVGGSWLNSALESVHYGASAADPVNWMCVVGVLLVAVLAPAWRPASQAARVDPALLLRDE